MSNHIDTETRRPANFIRDIVAEDVKRGVYGGKVVTRFPPEPNGYLHIGHAYAASISYGIAQEFGGRFHFRFDDTNPLTEELEYVESQKRDIEWLGLEWDGLFFASDYFDRMHRYAVRLIEQGKAYVCELSPEETRRYRGSFTEPGRNSPYRDRPVAENLELFRKMQEGRLPEGAATLRAKIDMSHPNLLMRDPVMYRITHAEHYRAGSRWKIYPMYDWAHGLEDSIEGVTHSLCSLEFENNRPLYDWFLEQLGVHHPKQIEFSRMNLSHTVMSKRKLLRLVEEKQVQGWDDPRMPTLSGMRRRGFPPRAIRAFLGSLGVTKSPLAVDITSLEHHVRQDLNQRARRVMAVLRPLKLVIENYPDGEVEWVDAENNPEDASMGSRKLPFCRTIYIEDADFRVDPPKKYFRLAPGKEVRLKHAYIIRCEDFVRDEATGRVTEIRCSYDPETRSGGPRADRKVKGTLHWVSAAHSLPAQVRLFDRLFHNQDPEDVPEGKSFLDQINPDSLEVLDGSRVEPGLKEARPEEPVQFFRHGYFCVDAKDSQPEALVFNRTISLKDTWAKIEKRLQSR